MSNGTIVSKNTIRKENAHDLFKLHPEHTQIAQVVASGAQLHTLLALYPFDIEEYAGEVTKRISTHANFNLFSHNLLKLYSGWLMEAKMHTATLIQIENGAHNWLLHQESCRQLRAALESRLSQDLSWTPPSFSSAKKAPTTPEKAQNMALAIYYALAYASAGAADFELHMSSSLKDIISHTLIYLIEPEIYSRWGSKNRAGRIY